MNDLEIIYVIIAILYFSYKLKKNVYWGIEKYGENSYSLSEFIGAFLYTLIESIFWLIPVFVIILFIIFESGRIHFVDSYKRNKNHE